MQRILKEHREKKSYLSKEQQKLSKQCVSEMEQLSLALLLQFNNSVEEVYRNQYKLKVESDKLLAKTAQFTSVTNDWLDKYSKFNDAVKELGHVGNWADVIYNDMKDIAVALEKEISNTKDNNNNSSNTKDNSNSNSNKDTNSNNNKDNTITSNNINSNSV